MPPDEVRAEDPEAQITLSEPGEPLGHTRRHFCSSIVKSPHTARPTSTIGQLSRYRSRSGTRPTQAPDGSAGPKVPRRWAAGSRWPSPRRPGREWPLEWGALSVQLLRPVCSWLSIGAAGGRQDTDRSADPVAPKCASDGRALAAAGSGPRVAGSKRAEFPHRPALGTTPVRRCVTEVTQTPPSACGVAWPTILAGSVSGDRWRSDMGLLDDAKGALSSDKAEGASDGAIDKAKDAASEKTGGKYDEKLDKASTAADSHIGNE